MLWDVFSGKPLLPQAIRHQGTIAGPWFRDDGALMVTHDSDATIAQVRETQSGDRVAESVQQAIVARDAFVRFQDEWLLLYDVAFATTSSEVSSEVPYQAFGRLHRVDLGRRPILAEPLIEATGSTAEARYSRDGTALIVCGRPAAKDPLQLMVFDPRSRQLQRLIALPSGVRESSSN